MEFGTDFSILATPWGIGLSLLQIWKLISQKLNTLAIIKQLVNSVLDTRLVPHGNWQYCYLGAITISEFTPNIPDLRIVCSWKMFKEACGSFIVGTWLLSLLRWREGRPRLERVSRHGMRAHLGQRTRRKSSEEKLRLFCKGRDLEALSLLNSHWRKISTYLFQAIVNRIFLQTLETLSFLTWNICRYSANCSGLTLI